MLMLFCFLQIMARGGSLVNYGEKGGENFGLSD